MQVYEELINCLIEDLEHIYYCNHNSIYNDIKIIALKAREILLKLKDLLKNLVMIMMKGGNCYTQASTIIYTRTKNKILGNCI